MDGLSHVVHSEEEAMGTRITIDSLTCLLANESDPSRLVAMSPGKLVRYLVPDGAHVDMDQPYAEVEVCLHKPSLQLPCVSCTALGWPELSIATLQSPDCPRMQMVAEAAVCLCWYCAWFLAHLQLGQGPLTLLYTICISTTKLW